MTQRSDRQTARIRAAALRWGSDLTEDDIAREILAAEHAARAEGFREGQEPLRKALRRILEIGERNVDEATGRRIADFREAIAVAREALEVDDA